MIAQDINKNKFKKYNASLYFKPLLATIVSFLSLTLLFVLGLYFIQNNVAASAYIQNIANIVVFLYSWPPIYSFIILFLLNLSLASLIHLFFKSRNPIYPVFILIVIFFIVTIYFIIFNAEYLSLMFLIVYAGAIAILFIFVVMMLNINVDDYKQTNTMNIIIPASFNSILFLFIITSLSTGLFIDNTLIKKQNLNTGVYNPEYSYQKYDHAQNLFIFLKDSQGTVGLGKMEKIANILYSDLSPLFLVTSFILFVSMIGAIILTLDRNKPKHKQSIPDQLRRVPTETVQLKSEIDKRRDHILNKGKNVGENY